MRLISTAQCQEGMEVAKTVYNDVGQALVSEGIPLTTRMISRLRDLQILYLYIKDERTADIEIKEVLSEKTRLFAANTIKNEFSKVIKNGKLVQVMEAPELGKKFRSVVKEILDDIRSHQKVMSVLMDVQSTDQYTFQHSLNVTIYTLALAMAQNYSEKQMIEIGLGAILHDVGKLTVPPEILSKPGKLTDEEFAIVKEHTTTGFNFIRKMHDISLLCAHCAYQHHERLDGSGYPRGLVNKEIHEYAKLIAIADVFDALTSNRSYRKAMLPHVAMEFIYSGAGTQFDLEFVNTFRNTISMYPIGMTVKLSNGYKGVVVDHNHQLPSRPIIRLLQDHEGQELTQIKEMDLATHLSVVIDDCDIVL
jgi:HD-GYP domain-containing protein (c-di-GMP phosphodiesterase class II)